MGNVLGDFLAPEGFDQPPMRHLLKEGAVVGEAGRALARALATRREFRATPYVDRSPQRAGEPVLLVPGFLAGDYSLRLMANTLRRNGFRTYNSRITSNVSCFTGSAALLERRLEAIATKRERRVRIVGHSLGGMLARGLAVRRPDLVSGIITMGSPMLAPGTAHPLLLGAADILVRLSRAGVPGLMNESCVAGDCASEAWEESRQPMPEGVGFTCIWSPGDGMVDPKACIDPLARSIEVSASHIGLALDPRVADCVVAELRAQDGPVIVRPTAS